MNNECDNRIVNLDRLSTDKNGNRRLNNMEENKTCVVLPFKLTPKEPPQRISENQFVSIKAYISFKSHKESFCENVLMGMFYRKFNIDQIRDLKISQFEDAVEYLVEWKPPFPK